MKKILTAVILLLLFTACKKQQPAPQTPNAEVVLPLTNFTKINSDGLFKLTITRSNVFSVTVAGRQVDIQDLNARVVGGELLFEYKNPQLLHELVQINITMPSLHGFHFNDRSNAQVSGFTEVMEVEGTVAKYSKATVQMNVTQFTIDVLDHSELTLNGNAEKVHVTADNQSTVNSYQVKAVMGFAVAMKNSIIRIYASDTINASASQNSTIYYKGNPGSQFVAELNNSKVIAE